jgi:hypothetical protein
MNTRFETSSRCSAVGVTTASILVVILAMAASTLFSPEASTSGATAAAGSPHVAQSHYKGQLKKS